MKILIINTYYFPNMIGGTEQSVMLLAEGLQKKGHEVFIFSADGEKKGLSVDYINGVKVYRNYNKSNYRRWKMKQNNLLDKIVTYKNGYYYHLAEKEISNIVEQENIDIIHTNNLGRISIIPWIVGSRRKIPVVHTLRDFWLLDPKAKIDGTSRMITTIHKNYFKKYCNNYLSYVTAPSISTLKLFSECGFFKNIPQKSIPNAIDIDVEAVGRCVQKKINKASDKVVFLFVGCLGVHKGIDILIKVFSKLENDKINLKICGSGILEEEVINACNNDRRISFLGQLCSQELDEIYESSDVLIVPSVWDEPFGRVVIEGASKGLPVIASNVGGIPEVVDTLKSGVLYEPNDTEQLSIFIEQFSIRKNFERYIRNIEATIGNYSTVKQIIEFEALYESIRVLDKKVK